jgi:hypothetical protein
MNKTEFKRIIKLHSTGVGTLTCIQCILETEKSKFEAAESIERFYEEVVIPKLSVKTALNN